jgi:hypothetical protein
MSSSVNQAPLTAEQMTVKPPAAAAGDMWDMPRDIDPANGIVRTVDGQERSLRATDLVPRLARVAAQGAEVNL